MIDFKAKKYFILDLDGTLYAGSQLFPYTIEFLRTLRKTGRKPVFLTNNSSKSTDEYYTKLKRLGIAQKPGEIYTSGQATIEFLLARDIRKIFLLAVPAVEREFANAGFNLVNPGSNTQDQNGLSKPENFDNRRTSLRFVRAVPGHRSRIKQKLAKKSSSRSVILAADNAPQAVVLAFDTTFTYEKFCRAHELITAGVPFYATHPDNLVPLENNNFHPDIGTLISAFHAATGKRPFIIGKPEKPIYKQLQERLGCKKNEMVMVGDRLYTDIKGANDYGIDTVLVMSGETTRAMLKKAVKEADGKAGARQNPTIVAENVGQLISHLQH